MIVNKPNKKKQLSRYSVLLIIMGIIFTVMTVKLLYIQVYKHDDYKEKADTTSTKFVSEKAPRGIIYDQDGNVLATNKQTYSISYTSTDLSNKQFFTTMDEVFKILKDNGKTFEDTLILKLNDKNQWYLEYKNSNDDLIRIEDLRFKKDRNFDAEVQKKLYPDVDELSDEQKAKIDEELVKITPQQIYYKLVKDYGLISLIYPNPTKEEEDMIKNMSGEEIAKVVSEKYSLTQQRDYIVIKDALKMRSYSGYKSVTIASNIEKDIYFNIMQRLNDLPGIDVVQEPIRYYPYKNTASSVLGYLSSIDTSQKENYELRGYDASSDLIGISGIEAAFEEQLKGVKGGTTVKVNSTGRVTEELFKLESYPGNNVHLTIDKDVQYAAEQALKDKMEEIKAKNNGEFNTANRGAVVAVEVKTGRILASASYPDFDPNLFAIPGQLTTDEYKKYFNPDLEAFGKELIKTKNLKDVTVDDLFPDYGDGKGRRDIYDLYPRSFFNYATQGLLPPGSIFKPLTAVAGLEEGVVNPDTIIYDKGKFTEHSDVYGSFQPECLIYTTRHQTHGAVDVGKALEVSCNYYFYEIAYRLYQKAGGGVNAMDTIARYAWKFGLGYDVNSKTERGTGIEIEERIGQVYSFDAYKENAIYYAKFDLAAALESGSYENMYNFIPFDYSYRDEDSEKVYNAKKSLKDKVESAFWKLGTDEEITSNEELAKTLVDDIKTIMKNSDVYKKNVEEYKSKGKTYNEAAQANTIAEIIARFIINDRGTVIKSPAQEVNSSIGQGMNNFTPMELAGYIATLANGGTRYKLHFVDKITTPDGKVVQEFPSEVVEKIDMKQSTIDAIRDGMRRANNEDGGTAAAAFRGFPIETGGKTGTADFRDNQSDIGRAPYATYVSFAPLNDPEIAFVGVIYDGGHGYYTASVARAVYEAYFKDRLPEGYTSESYQKYVVGAPADNKSSN